jgi:hypothetical protein
MNTPEITLTPGQHKYYGSINERLNRLKSEVANIFRTAKDSQLTHDAILQLISERVYQYKNINRNKEWYNVLTSLPEKHRNVITGYIDACLDLHRMYNIEWILYYDGKYIGNSKREKTATDAMYKNPSFDNSKVKGQHVYIGTENKY